MKTYLLRAPKTVEPQSARRAARPRPVTAPLLRDSVLDCGSPLPLSSERRSPGRKAPADGRSPGGRLKT
jgi:hypothetical protein